jgi:sulfur carrier protein
VHEICVGATFRVEYNAMELVINGKTEQLPDSINAAQLIEHLGLAGERLAMEVNREIVPRSSFGDYRFQAGDRIEIVRAIGGGCHRKAATVSGAAWQAGSRTTRSGGS